MKKINVLPQETADRIAAGEVVERPASIVKELVENSIDANASHITVEIKGGGISFLRITDDGCGISKEDMPTAFLRHATSKISNENDLFAISSLGFRGEALAAIGAVSRLSMISCETGAKIGAMARFEGGRLISVGDVGCPEGTTVIVRDVFYNTPARMKFLKRDITEREQISKTVERLAMSHPDISFTFIRDGKNTFHTSGDGQLKTILYRTYGKEVYDSLLDVDYTYNGIRVLGFVSKPVYARHNKGMQQFFLNGRAVLLRTASSAIDEAYRDQIMTKRYPAAFINLSIDPALVDVNVHPSKQEVKFGNEKQIYDAVFFAVKSALDSDHKRPVADQIIKPAGIVDTKIDTPFGTAYVNRPVQRENAARNEEFANLVLSEVYRPIMQEEIKIPSCSQTETNECSVKQADYIPYNAHINQEAPVLTVDLAQDKKPFKIIGEIFCSYIVVEFGDEVYLVDKHAAHERFIYESIKGTFGQSASQLLMQPVVVTLTREETASFLKNKDYLAQAGFGVEEFGENTIIVREVPTHLDGEDISSFVGEILDELSKNRNEVRVEAKDKIIATVACKAAVKAGKKSTEEEMRYIIEQLFLHTDIKYCPHGRPVAVVLTKYGIEKQFGRIV